MRTEPPRDLGGERVDDGTSVCTLGKPAHIPIDMEDSR